MTSNIVLIGFMGSGKTSVGKFLSKKMNYQFVDTDLLIEERANMTISNIFSQHGETYFRSLETQTLLDINKQISNTVVSAGGGIILKADNVKLIKEIGTVIYLKASAKTIIDRLKHDETRPLLKGDDREKKINDILDFRKELYENAANFIVDTDNKSFEEIILEIKEQVIL